MTRKQEIDTALQDEYDVLGDWRANYDLDCFECGEHYLRCMCYQNNDWMIIDGLCVAIISEQLDWPDAFIMTFGSEEADVKIGT